MVYIERLSLAASVSAPQGESAELQEFRSRRHACLWPRCQSVLKAQGPKPQVFDALRGEGAELVSAVCAHNLPAAHKVDAVDQVGQVVEAVLCDEDGRPLPLPFRHDAPDFLDGLGVEVGRGFVEDDERRLGHGDGRARDFLSLSARERGDAPVQQAAYAEGVDSLCHAAPYLLLGEALILAAEGKLAVGVHGVELAFGILEDRTDQARGLVQLGSGHAQTVDEHGALDLPLIVLRAKPVGQAGYGRFAASRLTGYQNDFSGCDGEVDVFDAGPLRSLGVGEGNSF